jgi:hypothetical protein
MIWETAGIATGLHFAAAEVGGVQAPERQPIHYIKRYTSVDGFK